MKIHIDTILVPAPDPKQDEIFSIDNIEKQKKRRHFDRMSDIAWDGSNARIGIDRVDELIYNLVYAGEFGLPQYRLYEILWPDELFSFAQHLRRLEQLVLRARERGYKILWKDLHLRLASKGVTTTGFPKEVIRGYSFLKEKRLFSRNDVQKYFSLSRASAILICRHWVKSGLVQAVTQSQYESRVR